jgi:hypothetical protein
MTITRTYMPIGFTLGVFFLCTGLVTTIRAGEHPKEFVLISFERSRLRTDSPRASMTRAYQEVHLMLVERKCLNSMKMKCLLRTITGGSLKGANYGLREIS